MGLPDILKVHFFLIPMMYVVCLVGFCLGILESGHLADYKTSRIFNILKLFQLIITISG